MLAAPVSGQHYAFLKIADSPHGIDIIFQDGSSGLWLGTADDAFHFDGEHFYSLRAFGFPKEAPSSFAEDNDGGIWITTQGSDSQGGTGRGGLYRYQAGRLVKILSGDGMAVVAVAPGIMIASSGTEHSGRPSYGDLSILRKSSNSWVAQTLVQKQAGRLTVDLHGNVVFPCPGGWCELNHQQLVDWHSAGSRLDLQRHSANPMIEKVLRDRFGCMWFRAEASASYQCPADSELQTLPTQISRYDSSAHLEETADGSVLMLVPLLLGRRGSFHVATNSNGIPIDWDTAMVARDGTIWIGTDTGLVRFMYPFQLESWGKEDGIGSPASIAREGDDIVASAGKILKLDKDWGRWNPVGSPENVQGNLTVGPNRTLFVANSMELTQIRSTGRIASSVKIPNYVDSVMTTSQAGDVWLAHGGINRVIAAKNRLTVRTEEPAVGRVRAIRYDESRKTLWACNDDKILFRRDGVWGEITQKDGLPNQDCSAIGIGGNGDLWIGYSFGAYTWISDPASGHPSIHNYFPRHDQPESATFINFLAPDKHGRLWMGKNSVNLSTPDAAKSSNWLQLDQQDGVDHTYGEYYSFLLDQDDSVWFGTNSGITHFSPPDNFATVFPVPPLFVAGFTFGRGAPTLADAVKAIPRNTEVIAHIGSLQFERRNALHIRYRLLPQQTAWTLASGFNIGLGKLAWGKHTLQVQARMATGEWSPIVEQSLPVPWPIWLTWPLFIVYVACGVGLWYGGDRWIKYQRAMRDLRLPDLSPWRMEAMSPEAEQLIGTVVDGRYEIGHVLSVGGFSTVARARDLQRDGVLCAVKIFRYELGDQAWVRHRFNHEVAALEQLSHPNIVKIIGHGTVDTGAPYLVMEFIHGSSVRDLLERGPMAKKQIGDFVGQIAGALAVLHQRSIYHRDIKPENLMFGQDANGDEQFILIDFSIAIVKSPDQTIHGISRVAGTLGYMAPEQVTGYADASTDIHSLAKVILEMLTGLRCADLFPEATLDLPEHVLAHFGKSPGVLSADSVNMLASALAFDPGHRPKNVTQFAAPIVRDLRDEA